MISIKPIHYGSPAYLETLELRNRVMRLPLGLNIHDEDFSFEQNCVLYAAFDGEQVIGMGSMSREGDTCKVEYLCVDTAIQSRGLGRQLLEPWKALPGNRVPPISVWMPGSQPSTSMSGPGTILWGKSSC